MERRSALVMRGQQSPAWTSVTGYAAGKINQHSLALRVESSKLADTALFVTFVADENTTGQLMISQRKKNLSQFFLTKYKKETLKSNLIFFQNVGIYVCNAISALTC